MSLSIKKILAWAATLLTPVVVVLLAVRVLLSPLFVEIEYRTPGFPADLYGFSRAERLQYAHVARQYVLSDPSVPSLADRRFPAGQQVPEFSCQFMQDCNLMYNEREVQHMLDVRNTISSAMLVLGISALALAGLGVWGWRGDWMPEYRRGLRRGGWLAIIVIGAVVAFALFAFGVIFVFFHEVFFSAGTWTFYYSDTLIRLFPERFWRDAFLAIGLLTMGLSGAVIGFTGHKK